jgi:polyhydroxyalkanoate synthase
VPPPDQQRERRGGHERSHHGEWPIVFSSGHWEPFSQQGQSSYKTTGLVSGPVRFVLSSGGHIAGIVNPPGPKAWYQVAESEASLPPTAEAWRSVAERRSGSWWEDWARWSAENSGPMQDPPPSGSAKYPVLGDGPGDYVRT